MPIEMAQGGQSYVADPAALDGFKLLCSHVVSVNYFAVRKNAKGKIIERPQFGGMTGFIIEHRGIWFLVTAGHLFEEIEEIEKHGLTIYQPSILDHFGASAKDSTRIPFDYTDPIQISKWDKESGLDFAAFALPLNTRDLLMSNGILPFSRKDWVVEEYPRFKFYAMLGFPTEDATLNIQPDGHGETVSCFPVPTLLHVEPLADDDIPRQFHAKSHRFVAKISSKAEITSVCGMSGGPILGFCDDYDGDGRYWPVAMQSVWLHEARVLCACPIKSFGPLIEQFVDRVASEANS